MASTFDGTPLEIVGETLNPDVSVGALDPATGAVDVGVDGTGLLEGVNVAVKTSSARRSPVDLYVSFTIRVLYAHLANILGLSI